MTGSLSFPPHVGDDGVWSEVLRPRDGTLRPALFLDRDGVIVEEVHYLHRPVDTRLIAAAAQVIGAANAKNIPVVVVTNQSGIGRGTYGWRDFSTVQFAMLRDLQAQDATVDAVFACPFHGNGIEPWNISDHPDRKPGPGMLRRGAAALSIDLGASWIVGDRAGDLGAGKNAGLAGGLHVLSGHGNDEGERAEARAQADETYRVYEGDHIGAALNLFPIFE